MRLPWLMEEILDWWDKTKARPQFKSEYVITHNIRASLEAAARAVAARLKMPPAETEALVQHYLGFPYPQAGPGAKPIWARHSASSSSRLHVVDGRPVTTPASWALLQVAEST